MVDLCLVVKWSAKSRDFTIWILDTHTVRYSDESSLQVFGIQMVTVETSRFGMSGIQIHTVPGDDSGSSMIAGVEGSNFFRFFRPFPPPGEELRPTVEKKFNLNFLFFTFFLYSNLVNFVFVLRFPVTRNKVVKVWMLKNLCLIA